LRVPCLHTAELKVDKNINFCGVSSTNRTAVLLQTTIFDLYNGPEQSIGHHSKT